MRTGGTINVGMFPRPQQLLMCICIYKIKKSSVVGIDHGSSMIREIEIVLY